MSFFFWFTERTIFVFFKKKSLSMLLQLAATYIAVYGALVIGEGI